MELHSCRIVDLSASVSLWYCSDKSGSGPPKKTASAMGKSCSIILALRKFIFELGDKGLMISSLKYEGIAMTKKIWYVRDKSNQKQMGAAFSPTHIVTGH